MMYISRSSIIDLKFVLPVNLRMGLGYLAHLTWPRHWKVDWREVALTVVTVDIVQLEICALCLQ